MAGISEMWTCMRASRGAGTLKFWRLCWTRKLVLAVVEQL